MADDGRSSKLLLVDAAVELVLEHHRSGADLRSAFGYLTPSAVAERAGVSRALIYHHWGRDDDAMRSLVATVAGRVWQRSADLDVVAESVATLTEQLDGSITLTDVVRSVSWVEMERAAGGRATVRAAQTLMVQSLVDPTAIDSLVDELEGLYATVGELLDLEPVPPLSWNDVAFAVSTVVEGFGYGVNVREEALMRPREWVPGASSSGPEEWNLLGVVSEVLLRRLLRPLEQPGA